MREIKFRAWDDVLGMKDVEDISFCGGFCCVLVKHLACITGTEEEQTYELGLENLMQYTGLKDKNGKEIYEGDIVKVHESGWHEVEKGTLEYVHWCSCGWGFCALAENPDKSHLCHGWTNGSDLEVIGNIYENPELIK
jgi:uncharacterized phage protein (TIGR01671 family)